MTQVLFNFALLGAQLFSIVRPSVYSILSGTLRLDVVAFGAAIIATFSPLGYSCPLEMHACSPHGRLNKVLWFIEVIGNIGS